MARYHSNLSESILNVLPERQLRRLKELSGLKDLSEASLQKCITIVSLIEGGGDILRARGLVAQLLLTIEADRLQRLSDNLLSTSFNKAYDNAFALSQIDEQQLSSLLAVEIEESLLSTLEELGIKLSVASEQEVVFAASQAKTLLPHQQRIVGRAKECIRSDTNFLVQMPTGAGKTTSALMVLIDSGIVNRVFRDGKLAIWLAPTTELLQQAAQAFKQLWTHYGHESAYVSMADSGSRVLFPAPGTLFFMTYQALASWDSGYSLGYLASKAAVLVADEAHRALAPTYRDAIEKISRDCIRVGLSATPGRTANDDLQNKQLADMFGGTVIRAYEGTNEIEKLQESGVLSVLRRTVLPVTHKRFKHALPTGRNTSVPSSESDESHYPVERATLEALARDDARNQVLLDTIGQRVDSGRKVIVFACTVEHSRILASALLLRGIASASVDGTTSASARQRQVTGFKDGRIAVLVNFTVFSAGFDVPGTDVVVISRPTSSIVTYSQMIGRALRGPAMNGSEKAEVVEFEDALTSSKSQEEIYNFFNQYWQDEKEKRRER